MNFDKEDFFKKLYLVLRSKDASYKYDFSKSNPESMEITIGELLTHRGFYTFEELYRYNVFFTHIRSQSKVYKDTVHFGSYYLKRINEVPSFELNRYKLNKTRNYIPGFETWKLNYNSDTLVIDEHDFKEIANFLMKMDQGYSPYVHLNKSKFTNCHEVLENNSLKLFYAYQFIKNKYLGDTIYDESLNKIRDISVSDMVERTEFSFKNEQFFYL